MTGSFKWHPGARQRIASEFAAALTETAEDVVRDVEAREVVPHAESARKEGHTPGRLASSVAVEPARSSRARITWDAPYAAKAYFHPEWEFSHAVHGDARGRWMDDYMGGGSRAGFVTDGFRRHLRAKGVL